MFCLLKGAKKRYQFMDYIYVAETEKTGPIYYTLPIKSKHTQHPKNPYFCKTASIAC